MPAAGLVVRATVANAADRPASDRWCSTEHLPDAVKAFRVDKAWRGWSQNDPAVHSAFYRFESLDRLTAMATGPEIAALIAEFDRCWGNKVVRTREIVSVADEVGG